MANLLFYPYLFIALIFVWNGFVRIPVHLLFFSSLTVRQNWRKQQRIAGQNVNE